MNRTYTNHYSLLAAAVSVWIAAATVSVAQSSVLYRNDFTERTSSGLIGGETHSLTYTNGSLINANAYDPYGPQNMQDGWIRGKNYNLANLLVKETNGNAYACICCTNGVASPYVFGLQPIGNSLTGGVVRISCDMRPPRYWNDSLRMMTFHLGPDAFFTGSAQTYYKYYGPAVGIASSNNSNTDFKFMCRDGDGAGGFASNVYSAASVDTTHWYRLTADLTLTNNKYTVVIYDMGTTQPMPETETPAMSIETFDGRSFGFRRNLTPVLGGVTTLSISAYGVLGGNYGEIDIDLTARFDNITIGFKPASGESFTGVYENDFRTRTYMRFGPGSTSYAYAVNDGEGGTLAYSKDNLVPDNILEYPNGANGPVGQDGWARRNSGIARCVVTNAANPFVNIYYPSGDSYCFVVQRIGNRLTNGTTCVSIDMNPPDAWYWIYTGMTCYLGDNAFYQGEKYSSDPTHNTYFYHFATKFGFKGKNESDIRFYCWDGDGANGGTDAYGTATVNTANWYRFVADLDLEGNTVVLNIYDLGPTQPASTTATPNNPVQTFSYPFRRSIGTGSSDLDGITSIGLSAYGPTGGDGGTNTAQTAQFDNINIRAQPAGFPEKVTIYANNFATRMYTNLSDYAVARLTGDIDMLSGSQDEWMRRNTGYLLSQISSAEGNPHFRSSSMGTDYAYAIQPLGTCTRAHILCCQADIRPPRYWVWNNKGIYVYLGDDQFWQGNRNDALYFYKHFGAAFGFGSSSTGTNAYGVYPDVSFLAMDGDGAGAFTNKLISGVVYTNWYRFKAEVNVRANTYTVKVYNLGSTHPTLETATPSVPVAVFENNRFKIDLRLAGESGEKLDGISSIGLGSYGVRGGGLYPANETALIDNLQVTVRHIGTLISIL